MLEVLFGSSVGILSIITVVGATAVVTFWLYFTFKKHED
ncbi:MAG: DUF3149 domain-containing protein [Methylophilaceae bacterium]|nr:DUF3149 domain-containing protein [Methylophilaceae bacterium]